MGGPIVRTGTNPAFWANWDNVFGGKKGKTGAEKKTATKAPAKKTAKAAPKSAKAKAAKGQKKK